MGNADPAQQPAENGYGSDNGDGSGEQAAAPKTAGRLAVWDSKELGKVVTDSRGFTLYRFDKDTASPPKSNCDGDCAKAWPVVPAGDATAAPGTDASVIGEVARADGTKQLAIGGRPMYRFTKDTKSGDAKSQGALGTRSRPRASWSARPSSSGSVPTLWCPAGPSLSPVRQGAEGRSYMPHMPVVCDPERTANFRFCSL